MDRKLIIRILETLELIYPNECKAKNLAQRLKLKLSEKEFSKVTAYLIHRGYINGRVTNSGLSFYLSNHKTR